MFPTSDRRSSPDSSASASVLQLRAQRLALAETQADTGRRTPFLVFTLGAEEYAVELSTLRSIHQPEGLTPVPCTPRHVAGALNVRGEIAVVLDAAALLGSDRPSPVGGAQVLLVDHPLGRLGLLVDSVLGVRELNCDQLERQLSGQDYVRGIADARVAVLDLDRLCSSQRIEVLEEVS